MGRKARFSKDDFFAGTLEVLSKKGLAGVTISAIAEQIRAPVGSVYHRFKSRELLLAELWIALIESFQKDFIEVLGKDDPEKAALYTLQWVRKHPDKARVFLLHHRDELTSGKWPESLKARVEELGKDLDKAISGFTTRQLGKPTKEAVARVIFALIQVPAAAVKPYLQKGEKTPKFFDSFVSKACHAILSDSTIDQ